MKKWNDDIAPFEAKRMSNNELKQHIGACSLKLQELGIDQEDARVMIDALMNIGYIWGKRVEKGEISVR